MQCPGLTCGVAEDICFKKSFFIDRDLNQSHGHDVTTATSYTHANDETAGGYDADDDDDEEEDDNDDGDGDANF